jgi:hypothetical protein
MTEIRKAVLAVCKEAELWKTDGIETIEDWKTEVKYRLVHAMLRYGKKYYACNKRAIQEAVTFSEVQLRDVTVVTAVASWVEKNYQTGTIHLQTACCSRAFGNIY